VRCGLGLRTGPIGGNLTLGGAVRTFSNVFWIVLFAGVIAAFRFEALTASQQIPNRQQNYRSETTKQNSHLPTPLNQTHSTEDAAKRNERQAKRHIT